MAAIKFNPGKPSGVGVETATGKRWITQGAWKFDSVTKELLPGQVPEQSLAPPQAPSWMGGGIETPDLPEGVTDPGAAPRDPVTKDLFDITVSPQEKNLPGKKDPVDSHPEVAPAALPAAGPVPGKKLSRKG